METSPTWRRFQLCDFPEQQLQEFRKSRGHPEVIVSPSRWAVLGHRAYSVTLGEQIICSQQQDTIVFLLNLQSRLFPSFCSLDCSSHFSSFWWIQCLFNRLYAAIYLQAWLTCCWNRQQSSQANQFKVDGSWLAVEFIYIYIDRVLSGKLQEIPASMRIGVGNFGMWQQACVAGNTASILRSLSYKTHLPCRLWSKSTKILYHGGGACQQWTSAALQPEIKVRMKIFPRFIPWVLFHLLFISFIQVEALDPWEEKPKGQCAQVWGGRQE